MVRIRLRRVGAKKQPSYRVVVADARSPRDGRFIENIGFYNPRTEPPTVQIEENRALHWLSVGAQPSEAVARMLKKMGTFDKLTRLRAGEDMETLLAESVMQEAETALEPAEEAVEEIEETVEAEAVERPVAEAEASEETGANETEAETADEEKVTTQA